MLMAPCCSMCMQAHFCIKLWCQKQWMHSLIRLHRKSLWFIMFFIVLFRSLSSIVSSIFDASILNRFFVLFILVFITQNCRQQMEMVH